MRAGVALIALLLAILGGAYYFGQVKPLTGYLHQGLDLKGGTYLVLEGVDDPKAGSVATAESVKNAIPVLQRRIDPTGTKELNITQSGSKRIIIELPGETDLDRAQKLIGTMAQLRFVDPENNVVITGKDVARATPQASAGTGRTGASVSLELKGEGVDKFAAATQKFIGQPIAIFLDDAQISAPTVQSAITNGRAEITGSFTIEEAKQLSDLLNGGSLPVKLVLKESRVVSATLGADSIAKSTLAGAVGMAAVAAFMLVFFGIPGLIANLALIVYIGLTFGAMILLDATLSLPGVAGIILGIGMAVDANILVFTRIREEIRAGKGIRSGMQAGFSRAIVTVLDSNVTTFIAGGVLYFMGSGPIKGFAVTLMLSIALSLFTAVTLTRYMMQLLVATEWFKTKTLFWVTPPPAPARAGGRK